MIIKWWKNRKAQREVADQKAISEWQERYFKEIKFPILIFDEKDYLSVSDLEEYYFDIDINIYAVRENSELVDSEGKIFNFKKINEQQWAPDTHIGNTKFENLKERIVPLLYMENHKRNIDMVKSIASMIDLLLSD